jgi:feruloyl esterase
MGADIAITAGVEQNNTLGGVTAKARGAGAKVLNTELPASWSANRTRPLYSGTGDVESASSFSCR